MLFCFWWCSSVPWFSFWAIDDNRRVKQLQFIVLYVGNACKTHLGTPLQVSSFFARSKACSLDHRQTWSWGLSTEHSLQPSRLICHALTEKWLPGSGQLQSRWSQIPWNFGRWTPADCCWRDLELMVWRGQSVPFVVSQVCNKCVTVGTVGTCHTLDIFVWLRTLRIVHVLCLAL